MMDTNQPPNFEAENLRLSHSWDQYQKSYLDRYLVSSVEDPRINCQSILTRSLIIDTLSPEEFTEEIQLELRFGVILCWFITQIDQGISKKVLLNNIKHRQNTPEIILETYSWLNSHHYPMMNFIDYALDSYNPVDPNNYFPDWVMDVFCERWYNHLSKRQFDRLGLLEPACGSANDYRGMVRCGLDPFIDYTGFDISSKNVENANTHFPNANFYVDSLLTCTIDDNAFEYVVIHDLLEHLSPAGIEKSLEQLVRITQKEAWIHCFNTHNESEHTITPKKDYYWNTLSRSKLQQTLENLATSVDTLVIKDWLNEMFGFDGYYNPGACTLIVRK